MFTAEHILARLKEPPFVPVRIVTSSGQSYDITHPDLVVVGRRYLFIGTPSNDNPQIFDAGARVALIHVVDLQDMPNPAPAGTNGPTA